MLHRALSVSAALSCLTAIAVAPTNAVSITLDANSSVSGTDPGVTLVGAWSQSTSTSGFIGSHYLVDGNTGGVGGKSVTYTPNIPTAGQYLVEALWTASSNRATNVPYDINFDGGSNTVLINQELNNATWVSLGAYNFAAGSAGSVVIRNDGANEFVIADGVRFSTLTQPPVKGPGSDDFESYSPASNLNGANGGTGWIGGWTSSGSHATIQPVTLSDPNNLTDGGTQAVRIQPTSGISENASLISRSFAPTASDSVYVGMLLRAESMESGDFINFQLSNGAAGNQGDTLGFGISLENRFFTRVGQSNASGDTDLGDLVVNDQDYLLVAKFSKDGNGQYGRVDLFIDPLSLTEPGLADLTSISTQPGITQVSRFNIRVNSLETDDLIFFDNLVIAHTFEDAIRGLAVDVPEPASLSLMAIAGLAMCRRRRAAV